MNDWNRRVRARAHRCLKPLIRYHDLTEPSSAPPTWIDDVSLRDGEERIGFYQNEPDTSRECVVVTTHGIHTVGAAGITFVAYEEIVAIEPLPDKPHADRLMLRLADGNAVEVPVRGPDGRFRDAFEILRFLRRVVALRDDYASDTADVGLPRPIRAAS